MKFRGLDSFGTGIISRGYENNNYMSEAIRETEPIWYIKSRNTIYYVLGVLEVLLLIRFLFKLLGANPGNGFVKFIYSLTGVFVNAFSGIFRVYATNNATNANVMEPGTIIAMLIYAIVAYGIIRLMRLKFAQGQGKDV